MKSADEVPSKSHEVLCNIEKVQAENDEGRTERLSICFEEQIKVNLIDPVTRLH